MPRSKSSRFSVLSATPLHYALANAQVALALLRAFRPRQWIKNFACLAGIIFSGKLFESAAQIHAAAVMIMFCAAASAVYIINDLFDREKDRVNPKKASRPIASGALPIPMALFGCAGCVTLSVALAGFLGPACTGVLILYLAMNIAYSLNLKHAVLADVMIIAMGFVLRVLAGVYAVQARPTPWIVLCIFFLALMLGFAKRRGELSHLKTSATAHRPVLRKYNLQYLDALLAIMCAMTIACYAIYTIESVHHKSGLIITIPPVVYGISRYMLLVLVRGRHSAEEILTRDPPLIGTVIVWIGLCVAVLYGDLNLFD